MNLGPIHIEWKQRGRALRLKETVLAAFHEPAPSIRARLGEFTSRDWNRAKFWLDVSGLALYFLDRLVALDLESCIPASMLNQLHRDFADNRDRTASLFTEVLALTGEMHDQKIQFSWLKGVTLPPESVPERALRSQMDLDVLVREGDANRVSACLAEFGYKLDAVSGSTWEFKSGPSGISSLKNLYQVRPERSIEVHLDSNAKSCSHPDRLARAEWRSIQGYQLPALSPADVFVLQGQHLFKHMCGEHTRASWVLEYWRHVCARRQDVAFWREVELVAANEPGASVAIGAATLLTTLVFGPFAPKELSRWSMDRLPPAVCLWIQLYGRRVLLSDTPGSKLYLLLRKQLNPHSETAKAERRRLLFPIHLPQRITRAGEKECLVRRLQRAKVQAQFAMRRLRFHLAEGARLAVESPRWERRLAGVSQ